MSCGRAFIIPAASLVVAALTTAYSTQFCDARDNSNRGRVLTVDESGVGGTLRSGVLRPGP